VAVCQGGDVKGRRCRGESSCCVQSYAFGAVPRHEVLVRGVAGVQSGRASNRGRMWTSGVVGEGVGVGEGAAVMRAGWACAGGRGRRSGDARAWEPAS
jgi:hypothetical protein